MLTSRLPQSTCSFGSTRRPSSAAASSSSSSLLTTVVEPSHSADTTPAHLLIGCCNGKARLSGTFPSVNPPTLNCCSSAFSVHQSSHPSSSSSATGSVSSPSLTTFRPTLNVDATTSRRSSLPPNDHVSPSSLSSVCCTDYRRSTTSVSSSSFPPPPPLSPTFLASLPTVGVTVSCTSPCVSCSSQELTSSQTSLTVTVVGRHTPCVDGRAQQMNTPLLPPPPPPPPPGVLPCLVPPPPLLPPGHRYGLPGSSSSPPQSTSLCGRTPRTKLRRLQWHKIPDSRVRAVGSGCVWAHVQRQLKADSAAPCHVDLERVEELFAAGSSSSAGGHGLTRPKSSPATVALERRKSQQVYY